MWNLDGPSIKWRKERICWWFEPNKLSFEARWRSGHGSDFSWLLLEPSHASSRMMELIMGAGAGIQNLQKHLVFPFTQKWSQSSWEEIRHAVRQQGQNTPAAKHRTSSGERKWKVSDWTSRSPDLSLQKISGATETRKHAEVAVVAKNNSSYVDSVGVCGRSRLEMTHWAWLYVSIPCVEIVNWNMPPTL